MEGMKHCLMTKSRSGEQHGVVLILMPCHVLKHIIYDVLFTASNGLTYGLQEEVIMLNEQFSHLKSLWSFLYVYIRNTSSRTILDPSSLQLDLVLNEKAPPGINFLPLLLAARQRKDIVFGAKKRGLLSYNEGDGHGIGREGKGEGGVRLAKRVVGLIFPP
ncbi:hypothetical protein ACFX14_025626 [Malus domestica]